MAMASARVINYISYKRVATASTLKHVCIFSNFYTKPDFWQNSSYCTKKSITKTSSVESENKVQVGFAEVVKENTKFVGYLGVILGGLGVTALMLYSFFHELFSDKSRHAVYSKALERCASHPKVVDALGKPIKAYGDRSFRGSRHHISQVSFIKDGVGHMRMKFHIQGIRRSGTVQLEVQEDETGTYVYRYLYVLVDDILQTVIKIEDNRNENASYSIEE